MDVACQVADVLSRLHQLTIIHRDVSVCNIMRSRFGTMKLADFGISRMCNATLRITNGSSIQGNVPYMAPEQGNPETHTTDKSDIWSFAASMLEAWSGQMPYGTLNQYQILIAHMQRKPPPTDVPHRPLPPPLREVLDSCFAADPADRPSAAALSRQLCNVRDAVLKEAVRLLLPCLICMLVSCTCA